MGRDQIGITRRRVVGMALGLVAGALPGGVACTKKGPTLRIASNVWPGYELMYLAREKRFFDGSRAKLVEVPSATVAMQSLAAGAVEGAMLTLDEVISARASGLDLKVVMVMDVSLGADVLMTRPEIKSLRELKGKRVGVEQTAVGAVMLAACLEKAGYHSADIDTVYLPVNRHLDAYRAGEVDALITFEPVLSQLALLGAKKRFDSAEIPGRIVDVLAVLPGVLRDHRQALEQLIGAHFQALKFYQTNMYEASAIMARRLALEPARVPAAFEGLSLPDLAQNKTMLSHGPGSIRGAAMELMRAMKDARLLSKEVNINELFDASALSG